MGELAGVDVQERRHRGDLIIELSGELDAVSAPPLVECFELVHLDDGDLERIVVDLDDLSFLDSSGISALISLHRRADAAGLGFRVANVRDTQHRVLEIVGLLDYFHVGDEQEHA